jgi:ABC-type uncharacterized transport system substrate-binding protein
MIRTAALAAATFAAAVAFPVLLASPAQAAANHCVAILEYAEHEVTDATREACKAGEEDVTECVELLSADGVKDDRVTLVACLAADLPAGGEA